MSLSYGRMSEPDCPANVRSSSSGSIPAPGFLPARVRPTAVSGQIRKRSESRTANGSMPNTSCGGRLKRMLTSVAVTGMHLPARIRIGTPSQRQVSAASRTATKVSVVDFGSTPSTSW